MLRAALTFLVFALISAFLGFGGIASVSMEFARITFAIFLVLFLFAAIMHLLRGKAPPV
jgi:uncharacterized membrane protein YtjA (UPF0391 family)